MKVNIITDAGRAYLQKSATENTPLKFSSIKVGDGVVGTIEEAKALTNLKSLKKNLGVLDVQKAGTDVTITTPFNNLGVTASFHLKEVGIYVLDANQNEVLFWYINYDAESNFVNSEDLGVIRVDLSYRLIFSTDSVSVTNVNSLGTFVTKEYLDLKVAETIGGDLSDKLSKSLGGVVEKKVTFNEGISLGGGANLRFNPETGNIEFIFEGV